MRNINIQVISFDLVPRLLPELHRKSERRRKLLVGFNGDFPARGGVSGGLAAKGRLAVASGSCPTRLGWLDVTENEAARKDAQ